MRDAYAKLYETLGNVGNRRNTSVTVLKHEREPACE